MVQIILHLQELLHIDNTSHPIFFADSYLFSIIINFIIIMFIYYYMSILVQICNTRNKIWTISLMQIQLRNVRGTWFWNNVILQQSTFKEDIIYNRYFTFHPSTSTYHNLSRKSRVILHSV